VDAIASLSPIDSDNETFGPQHTVRDDSPAAEVTADSNSPSGLELSFGPGMRCDPPCSNFLKVLNEMRRPTGDIPTRDCAARAEPLVRREKISLPRDG
jgi:hypothetical protein